MELDPEGLEKAVEALMRDYFGKHVPGADDVHVVAEIRKIVTPRAVAAIRAYEAHRSAGGASVPAGWKLVPEEPTERMIAAGAGSLDYPSVFMGGPSHASRRRAPRVWSAMLDAAPPPAAPQAETAGKVGA